MSLDHVERIDKRKFCWRLDGRSIVIGEFSSVEDELTGVKNWADCILETDCTFEDLVRLWLAVRTRIPAAWLYYGAVDRLFSPRSFLEEEAMPLLCPALVSDDEELRERGLLVFQAYANLAGPPRNCAADWRNLTPHNSTSLFNLPPPLAAIRWTDQWEEDPADHIHEFDKHVHEAGVSYHAFLGDDEGGGLMIWVSKNDADFAVEALQQLHAAEDQLVVIPT
jgi:hypothetical protein